MSLLMDALKKAEQAKRLGQANETTDTDSPAQSGSAPLELELVEPTVAPRAETPSAPGSNSLPELPSQLDVLDEEFMEHIKRSPAPRQQVADKASSSSAYSKSPVVEPILAPASGVTSTAPASAQPATERAAAKNVFEAKQAPAATNKVFAIAVGVVTLLAAIGIGVYFWIQLKPAQGLAPIAQIQPPRPLPAASVPVPPPQPPVNPSATAPVAPPPKPVETPATVEPVAKPVEQAAVPVPAPRAAAQTPAPDAPIRITTSRLKLNPALTLGFEALNNGNLGAAQGDYAQVLKAEPKNADALHGMAAIAVREGRYDEAEQYYLRSMEADPKDAIAQAGLYGLRGQVDPVSSESRLKSLIASQPDQPSLQFALGNVYAGVGRWSEAQQAFFKAYTGDPDHPDYLFNLAISLDHLRQTKLAAQYYNQALAAAANRPASFDKAQATARLRELQQ
jgi:Flp pilus assembly protein TadD